VPVHCPGPTRNEDSVTIYHLVPTDYWRGCDETLPYLPREFDRDGFIHCTRGLDLMLHVANTFYRDAPGDFLLLAIDEGLVSSEVRYEGGFPHVYGPLNREAIITVYTMPRREDGRFSLPVGLESRSLTQHKEVVHTD
jgi:uncharacterized protein (DUF952 family)